MASKADYKRIPYDEIFFDKKCGKDSKPGDTIHSKFFNWCSNPGWEEVTTRCDGIGSVSGPCEGKVQFLKEYNKTRRSVDDHDESSQSWTATTMATIYRGVRQVVENATTPAIPLVTGTNVTTSSNSTTAVTKGGSKMTTTSPPMPTTVRIKSMNPKAVKFTMSCSFGDNKKPVETTYYAQLKDGDFDKIKTYCYQDIHGEPDTWPLWLVILIVLLVIAAVSAAFAVFWRYWLRRRIYGRQEGEAMSTLDSHWTASPVSSASAMSGTGSSQRRAGSQRGSVQAFSNRASTRSTSAGRARGGSTLNKASTSGGAVGGGVSSNFKASSNKPMQSVSRTPSGRSTSQLHSTRRSDHTQSSHPSTRPR